MGQDTNAQNGGECRKGERRWAEEDKDGELTHVNEELGYDNDRAKNDHIGNS